MAQLLGTSKPDLFELEGTVGNIVYGYAGNDDFYDSVGNDWMRGGAGDDQFYSTSGSDRSARSSSFCRYSAAARRPGPAARSPASGQTTSTGFPASSATAAAIVSSLTGTRLGWI